MGLSLLPLALRQIRGGTAGETRLTSLSLLLVLALLLGGCAPAGVVPWRGIIKIGVVAPYSGPAPALGLSLLAGARRASDELNRQGGVKGYRVEIVALDERASSTPADLIVDPGVVAVVGQLSPNSDSAARSYQAAGLAWFATTSVAPGGGRIPMVAGASTVDQALSAYLAANTWNAPAAIAGAVTGCRQAVSQAGQLVQVGATTLLCSAEVAQSSIWLADPGTGDRPICLAGCAGPEAQLWVRPGATLVYVTPMDLPPASAAWDAFAAKLADPSQRTTEAGLGYDGVDLVAQAAGRADGTGQPTRATVLAALGSLNLDGVVGHYGSAGMQGAVAEVREGYPGRVLTRVTEGK